MAILAPGNPALLATLTLPPQLAWVWAFGLVLGLVFFARGLIAYQLGTDVATIASSSVQGLAAGEVRVSGTVEPGFSILVSPLQSRRCVHYRSRVTQGDGDSRQVLLDESRSVGFRLRDATGAVHVFPRGARWELEPQLDEHSGLGGDPASLDLNVGPRETFGPENRDEQIARLLTVHGASESDATLFGRTVATNAGSYGSGVLGDAGPNGAGMTDVLGGGMLEGLFDGDATAILAHGRHYVEARVEPGDIVTVVGTAVPFAEVGDGSGTDEADALDDPEVAADLAAAGAAGTLRARSEDAWGNAAIPGFGIGRPIRTPDLDPNATPEPAVPPASGQGGAVVADAAGSPATLGGATAANAAGSLAAHGGAVAAEAATTSAAGAVPGLEIGPDELVLAAGSTPMTVFAGTPAAAAGAQMSRFWQGLGGALLAVACAALLLVQFGVH